MTGRLSIQAQATAVRMSPLQVDGFVLSYAAPALQGLYVLQSICGTATPVSILQVGIDKVSVSTAHTDIGMPKKSLKFNHPPAIAEELRGASVTPTVGIDLALRFRLSGQSKKTPLTAPRYPAIVAYQRA